MASSSMTPISIGAPHPWPSFSSSSSSSLASPPSSKAYTYNYDCSLSLCSINCPQFCGVVLPPPPPLFLNPNDGGADDSSPSSHISPLMAALIAVLAAAFLLLFYFTVISRLCRRRRRRSNQTRFLDPDNADRIDSLIYDSARPTTNNESGLDDSFIRQITVFKFRREDKLVDGTECAVCLTEFNENESLRLMPNCEHAFHLPCIDTWLKTHSSCPLCRSTMNSVPVPVPNPNPTSRSGLGSIGSAANTNATAATASVAALRVQLSDDAVLVIRELESRVQVFETTTAADEVGSLGGAECRNYIIEDNNNHNHNNNINRETKLEINNNNHRNSR